MTIIEKVHRKNVSLIFLTGESIKPPGRSQSAGKPRTGGRQLDLCKNVRGLRTVSVPSGTIQLVDKQFRERRRKRARSQLPSLPFFTGMKCLPHCGHSRCSQSTRLCVESVLAEIHPYVLTVVGTRDQGKHQRNDWNDNCDGFPPRSPSVPMPVSLDVGLPKDRRAALRIVCREKTATTRAEPSCDPILLRNSSAILGISSRF